MDVGIVVDVILGLYYDLYYFGVQCVVGGWLVYGYDQGVVVLFYQCVGFGFYGCYGCYFFLFVGCEFVKKCNMFQFGGCGFEYC